MIRPAVALLLIAFPPLGAGATDLGSAGELSGSYRNLFAQTRDSSGATIRTDFNRVRLVWQGDIERWSWLLTYDHLIAAGGLVQSPDFAIIRSIPEPTYLDLAGEVASSGFYQWRHRVYRAAITYDWGGGRFTAGRQRIAWGSGRLWNPTDRFNPISPTAVEPEEKTGVDSAFGEVRFGPFGALQGVAAPGNGARHVSRKLALRWRDTVGETDYAIVLGRIGDDNILGLDLAGNLWEGGIRFEGLLGRPFGGDTYAQVATGYDYTLVTALLPDGLYLLAEYFYNGVATGRPPSLTPADRLESRNQHLLGFSAGYDLTPLWRLDGLAIWDPEGSSLFFSPKLTWSASADIELSLFAQLFAGDTDSEFGQANDAYLLRFEVFF